MSVFWDVPRGSRTGLFGSGEPRTHLFRHQGRDTGVDRALPPSRLRPREGEGKYLSKGTGPTGRGTSWTGSFSDRSLDGLGARNPLRPLPFPGTEKSTLDTLEVG